MSGKLNRFSKHFPPFLYIQECNVLPILGKTKKKIKKPMSLDEFQNTVAEESGGNQNKPQPQVVVHHRWAEDQDQDQDQDQVDYDQGGEQQPSFSIIDRLSLPTAPKSVLNPDIDLKLVPKQKPFRAHISNISFEAEESQIRTFFKDSKVIVLFCRY